jgi:predicted flap endonuclease-1-like 5' DNA nuclease/glycosidase
MIPVVEQFFDTQPGFAALGGLKLFRALRMPALSHPYSLEAQLEFLLGRFSGVLGEFAVRLLSSVDLIREEGKWFLARHNPPGPGGFGGEVQVQTLSRQLLEVEPENFTVDRDWMPRLVLMAKNAFVWLDQLSKQYRRPIRTLADVPDQELDKLASWGISGLWLIGLWERSKASRDIKQRMGNPDAVASAYSLYDYVIASDLGGDAALENLKARAWARGIRMASDMVPNHVGIDGRWVIQHPDWFVQLPYPPFPSYSFNGPDLSNDPRVGIFLEDHYWDHSDAAVVFKRVDRWTGEERFIYHGNDGTSLPWNDTAQLNYLRPDVREAVIQTILHVAKQFPVIRFDAAMTLAKKHIQRLWFPEPGSGAPAIASRGEFGLSKAEFDGLMPEEFWREVVDRCAVEAPDTLLLAEAFWMMEGYFVRTLGMHRVYNSAFMNMLRDEKNAEYRTIMKNTMEFEPEIMKRFVNFLNNPDEKTAVDQFGKGDKYFGAAVLCATLPGLPMVGHGQVEGYAEKYGMEYQRAYYDETPDEGLIEYHRQQVFPLFHKRYLFAEVQNFVLYDFHLGDGVDGIINDDVYAYSNRFNDERGLIVYHNKYGTTRGTIRLGDRGKNRGASLVEGLGLNPDGQHYAIYRDWVTGLEYIRNSRELAQGGLEMELGAYERKVLMDWREVYDWDGRYWRIAQMLSNRGVPNVEDASRDLVLEPILGPWREIVNAGVFRRLIEARKPGSDASLMGELEAKLKAFADGVESLTKKNVDGGAFSKGVRADLERALNLNDDFGLGDDPAAWGGVFGFALMRHLGQLDDNDTPERARSLIDEWRLAQPLENTLRELGGNGDQAYRASIHTKLFVGQQDALEAGGNGLLEKLFADAEGQAALGVNRYRDVLWFNKEAFNGLLDSAEPIVALLNDSASSLGSLRTLGTQAGYQVEELLALTRTGKTGKVRSARPKTTKTAAKKASGTSSTVSRKSKKTVQDEVAASSEAGALKPGLAKPAKRATRPRKAVQKTVTGKVPASAEAVPITPTKATAKRAAKPSGTVVVKPKTETTAPTRSSKTTPTKPTSKTRVGAVTVRPAKASPVKASPSPAKVTTTITTGEKSGASKGKAATKTSSTSKATGSKSSGKGAVNTSSKPVAARTPKATTSSPTTSTKAKTTKTPAKASAGTPRKATQSTAKPGVSSRAKPVITGKAIQAGAKPTKLTAKPTAAKPTGKKATKNSSKPSSKTAVSTIPDDLTRIEGIGPKMAAALQEAGITTFAALSKAKSTALRAALEAAGLRFAPSLPTWARQARYLERGDEAGFKAYTTALVAGREEK